MVVEHAWWKVTEVISDFAASSYSRYWICLNLSESSLKANYKGNIGEGRKFKSVRRSFTSVATSGPLKKLSSDCYGSATFLLWLEIICRVEMRRRVLLGDIRYSSYQFPSTNHINTNQPNEVNDSRTRRIPVCHQQMQLKQAVDHSSPTC